MRLRVLPAGIGKRCAQTLTETLEQIRQGCNSTGAIPTQLSFSTHWVVDDLYRAPLSDGSKHLKSDLLDRDPLYRIKMRSPQWAQKPTKIARGTCLPASVPEKKVLKRTFLPIDDPLVDRHALNEKRQSIPGTDENHETVDNLGSPAGSNRCRCGAARITSATGKSKNTAATRSTSCRRYTKMTSSFSSLTATSNAIKHTTAHGSRSQ